MFHLGTTELIIILVIVFCCLAWDELQDRRQLGKG